MLQKVVQVNYLVMIHVHQRYHQDAIIFSVVINCSKSKLKLIAQDSKDSQIDNESNKEGCFHCIAWYKYLFLG